MHEKAPSTTTPLGAPCALSRTSITSSSRGSLRSKAYMGAVQSTSLATARA